MTEKSPWENIYSRGEQLNSFPYTDVVAFGFRRWGLGGGKGKLALDVGCGSGIHSDFLSKLGARVYGIDFSPSVINHARGTFGSETIKFDVADFASFDPKDRKFDLVVDRCSTTHTSPEITRRFYQSLKKNLNAGALVFWQGFAWDNSGKAFGTERADGSWSEFTEGIFKELGQTAFFTKKDLSTIFDGYQMQSIRHLSDRDVLNEQEHTSWILELKYG